MGAPTKKAEKKRGGGVGRAPQQFHYHSHYKDSISVQKRRNRVNDDEEHEEHPHLEDFLVVHHAASVDPLDVAPHRRPTLARPPAGILHNPKCPSRQSCDVTEGRRRVSFHQVTVRDYDMILGDHPCCSYGPPVTLGWHYLEYEPLDLNEYEFHHARRRPLRELMLNFYRRKELLTTANGHTDAELRRAVKEKDRVNRGRSITRGLRHYGWAEDALESAGRKLRRAVKKNPTKKYWEPKDELDWSMHSSRTSILKTTSAST